jgi:hypothetical protein
MELDTTISWIYKETIELNNSEETGTFGTDGEAALLKAVVVAFRRWFARLRTLALGTLPEEDADDDGV